MSLDRMGLQVSCGVRAQGPKASDLRTDATAIGADFPCTGATKGMPDSGRTSDAGPCTNVYRHSAQTPSGFGNRISEREECDRDRPTAGQGTEFLGGAFLGSGLCRFVFVYQLERLKSACERFRWTNGTPSVTVGLDETR